MEYKAIKSSELGANCWLPARFLDNTRCQRIEQCNYPEKINCKAVDAEIAYIKEHTAQVIQDAQNRLDKQLANLEKVKSDKLQKLKRV
jgi:hypothetical protein